MGPPSKLTVSEWADRFRVLSSEASAEPGLWSTDRAPFQRGIMDAVSEEEIHTVVVKSSSQVGKTEFLLNALGFVVDQDPGPVLCLQPNTKPMGEAFSKDRVAPMFRDTPSLRGKLSDPRSRDSSNTLLHKKFPGGHLTITGANSPASLASRPIRYLFADEIDRFPVSAGTEGDPLALAIKRTTTFHNRKLIFCSTPTVKDASRIEAAFLASDQRHYHVPCPECGDAAPLVWSNLIYPKDDEGNWTGGDPWYCCGNCGCAIYERAKMTMLRSGQWVAHAEFNGSAGFHLNELYSPWKTWREMVEDWHAAQQDTELLRVFVNTSLGETFEEKGQRIDKGGLMARREPYPADVPAGALMLAAGVDVQDNRLEATVWGFGRGEESWAITHRVLFGDPADDVVWGTLEELLFQEVFAHEGGRTLRIAAAAVDSGGHHTQRVYRFCADHQRRNVFAIKGLRGFGTRAVGTPSRIGFGNDGRTVALYGLGVDELKRLIANRLERVKPGPGYVHFPDGDEFDQEYFDQLAAEELRRKMVSGAPVLWWKQVRDRNEALDCAVYAYAAMVLRRPNFDKLALKFSDSESPEPAEPKARRAPARRRNYATSWRD